MSALAERTASATACTHCGAPLAADQDWCLECGAAVTTRISAAPDWRVPVVVVGGVVALAAAALVFLLVSLSNSANSSVPAAAAPATRASPATAANAPPAAASGTVGTTTPPAAKTTATASTTAAITSWPAGVTGFTVVLGVIPDKAAATASATKIAAAGIPVGLLYSSDYSSMSPGDWIVFSGTYSTSALASAAATALKAKGQTSAYAFSVVPAPASAAP